ncbi:hypothetical protein PHYSODRAFT_457372, partial [Phytophthora sojae]
MATSPFIRPICWSLERCADKQHTGEFMASELNKVIQAVENVVGKGSVCAVVTDNASNRRKSWELLMAKIPSLTYMFGMEFMSDVFKKAVLVTKFVRKRAALLYRFRALQRKYFGTRQRRRALMIPVSTRWYSSTNCISRVVRNEDVLRELFSNHEFLARYGDAAAKLNRVESILADSMFWVNARAVMRLVNPIIQALGALEKDGCCLSMVYEYFRGLKTHISSRWNTLKRESMLAAFLLDPTKSTDDFEGDDLDNAVDACVDLATRVGLPSNVSPNAVHRAVMAFIRVKKSWTAEDHEKTARDTPLDWWLVKVNKFPLLHALATRVLSIPTSSAASERSWSVHSFIRTKRRNRLKPDRVEKLAYLYSN